jgi:hypothetical protein
LYSDAGKVGNGKLIFEIIMKDSKIRHKQETMFEGHDEQHDMTVIYSHLLSKEGAGIATRYGLEGPGIEIKRQFYKKKFRWGQIFRTCPGRLWGPPSLLYNGYRVFPGGKGGRGVMMTTHPPLVPRLRKS